MMATIKRSQIQFQLAQKTFDILKDYRNDKEKVVLTNVVSEIVDLALFL
jgi:hypothetical protein